jgi:arsenate reductase
MTDKIILFVCKGNYGRSQMAEAFFNSFSKIGKAISAGTKPDEQIHPWTIQVMKKVGIEVSQQKTKLLTFELMKKADRIIIMDPDLSKNVPPEYLSKIEVWQIDKLLGKSIEQIKKIRDQIKTRVEQLIRELSLIKNTLPSTDLN